MTSDKTCYMCDNDAVYLYEGTIPPAGTIRKATCRKHRFREMDPIERLDVDRESSSIPFPIKIDLNQLTIDRMNTGEWELEFEKPNGESLHFYTNHPDNLYDQLIEQGGDRSMTDLVVGDTVECSSCGSTVTIDEDGYATCYGNPDVGLHSKCDVTRPCGMCEEPIRTAEYCRECADTFDSSAVDPIWGR